MDTTLRLEQELEEDLWLRPAKGKEEYFKVGQQLDFFQTTYSLIIYSTRSLDHILFTTILPPTLAPRAAWWRTNAGGGNRLMLKSKSENYAEYFRMPGSPNYYYAISNLGDVTSLMPGAGAGAGGGFDKGLQRYRHVLLRVHLQRNLPIHYGLLLTLRGLSHR
ncbi:hypothetical protein Pcinc_030060 [Petrolisthes cinctipes]|uniref:Uncharacterized protein n=1 Tax=Petrolisthes cinctipes TaxID=88211 RepID=A0AAE1EYU6_PETCI|nr:hypothetical protein Pcinc_030060 [Petrolisthes cinctipes]